VLVNGMKLKKTLNFRFGSGLVYVFYTYFLIPLTVLLSAATESLPGYADTSENCVHIRKYNVL